MELLTALPPDLAAIADPSARGTAPFLRPPDSGGAPATAATPFASYLALLTSLPTGGEALPKAGKELPVLPLDPEIDADAALELAPGSVPTLVPTVLAADALQTSWRLADAPGRGQPPATGVDWQSPRADGAPVQPPSPSSESPAADALAPQSPADLDPLAALATADAELTALEAAESTAPSAAAKTAALTPSWLEAFTHERRLQQPLATTPTELRAVAEPVPAPTASVHAAANQANAAAAAVVETAGTAQGAARRVELPKILPSVAAVAESSSTSLADWLPPATGHGAATSAAAAPPTAVPGAPVDLRSPNWQEGFANRVQWVVDVHVGEAHIKLNPPELGAVDVKISLVDDKTYVQLTTATAAARDELAHSLPRLRELFTASGLELGGANVQNGRDGQNGSHGRGGDTASANAWPFAADGDAIPTLAARRSLGRIDVFA
jgi:flagellar hook-length control protein FliK